MASSSRKSNSAYSVFLRKTEAEVAREVLRCGVVGRAFVARGSGRGQIDCGTDDGVSATHAALLGDDNDLTPLQVECVVGELLTHAVDALAGARADPDAAEVERAGGVGGQTEGQSVVAGLADHNREGGLGAARVVIVEGS